MQIDLKFDESQASERYRGSELLKSFCSNNSRMAANVAILKIFKPHLLWNVK